MRTIFGLTVACVLIMAATMAHISDAGAKMSGVAFGEALFSTPMIIACLLSLVMRRTEPRRVLLTFEIAFSILTLLVFVNTFAGEHDAQYQLALLFIPLIGFPGVVIAGVIAALLTSQRRTE